MGIKQDRTNKLKSICKRISAFSYTDLCKEFPELYQKKVEADTAFSPNDINIESRLSKAEIQNVTAEDKEKVKSVLSDLKKEDLSFKSSDIERLNLFTNRIDFVLRGTSPSGAGLNNRINNIYNDREINGQKISIVQLFNEIKESDSWKGFEASSKLPKEFWNKGLRFQPLLPYLYSLIKNCQDKNNFPLFYKQWQLEAQFFFNIPNFDYDSFCIHYRSLNSLGSPKLLNFSIYYFLLLEKLKTDLEYITLTKDEEDKIKIDELIFIDKKPNILIDEIDLIENADAKYWLYAPGENAEMWNEFYEQGIMGLGWDELGDLNNYSSKEELTTKLQELEKTTGSKKNDSTANYEFKDIISIGDIIIAKKGRGELLGYGVVSSDYYYDKERARYQKCRTVEWKKKGNWKTDHSLALKTLTDITKYPSEHQAYEKYYDRLLGLMNSNMSLNNYKEEYTLWLNKTNQNDGGAKSSYLRAIEILSTIVKYNIFEVDDINKIDLLYEDLIKEQRVEGGKYYNEAAPSYGNKGFYSASIKTYSDFLKDYFSKNKTMAASNFSAPLNKILYGPPGTGKTYNSIDKAVAIATGSSSDHISNKKQFDELRKQGQIEFVTFHQNYSYEDFMVGIRPNVSETTSELSFKKHYGIFYEIAKRAKENYENSLKDEQTISRENWVNEKFEEFKEYVESEIEENGKFAIKNNVSIYAVEDEVFIYTGEKENGELWKNQRIGMHYDALINIYLADVQNRQDIKKLENVPSLEKQHATYSFELIEKFREFLTQKGYKFQSTTVQKEPLKNFVLIIDEINRANISKVFGELITLLEDDKRIGEPNELKITLPNGEKEFGVPPNLYLIGTMNTADKSIALIDIALRRRFEFIGKYPDYDEIKNVDAKTLLQKINEEIYKLKNSADYLIGHAYFMKGQAIEETLRNKIVPLLMEYFSGKTKIVSDIFNDTNWKVEYDTTKFDWTISIR